MVTQSSTMPDRLVAVRWLALAGIVVAVAWGILGYHMLQSRLDDLTRTGIPGQVAVNVTDPGGLTIFYEDPTAAGGFLVQAGRSTALTGAPVDVSVTDPTGQTVTTASYQHDLRFTHDGRTVIALATFEAPSAGSYTLNVQGSVPDGAMLSVGRIVDLGLLANAAGAVVVFIASLGALVVAWVVGARKEAQARLNASV